MVRQHTCKILYPRTGRYALCMILAELHWNRLQDRLYIFLDEGGKFDSSSEKKMQRQEPLDAIVLCPLMWNSWYLSRPGVARGFSSGGVLQDEFTRLML